MVSPCCIYMPFALPRYGGASSSKSRAPNLWLHLLVISTLVDSMSAELTGGCMNMVLHNLHFILQLTNTHLPTQFYQAKYTPTTKLDELDHLGNRARTRIRLISGSSVPADDWKRLHKVLVGLCQTTPSGTYEVATGCSGTDCCIEQLEDMLVVKFTVLLCTR